LDLRTSFNLPPHYFVIAYNLLMKILGVISILDF